MLPLNERRIGFGYRKRLGSSTAQSPIIERHPLFAKYSNCAQHLIARIPARADVVREILPLIFCIVVRPQVPGILKFVLGTQDHPIQLPLLNWDSLGVLSD